MSLYSENFVLKYTKLSIKLQVTIVAKELDSHAAVSILGAVLQEDYEYVKRMKEKFNFQVTILRDNIETVL